MHLEKVRFDDVFDVVQQIGAFSFRSGSHTEYGVQLEGKMIPRQGATYVVAFAKKGNWNTVVGWRDLASNEVTLLHPTWSSWLFAAGNSLIEGLLLLTGGVVLGGALGAAVVTAMFVGMAVYQTRLNGPAKRALLAAGADGDGTLGACQA